MITPRTTRLWRAPDLKAFLRAIAERLPADAPALHDTAVLVPTEGAAGELRRTLEHARGAGTPPPEVLTRDGFYESLRARVPGMPPPLSPFAREVLLRSSAAAAAAAGAEPPFNVRPTLVAQILALYDELRRSHRTVADFDRLLTGALEPGADYDRGAARLLQQTRFLVETFTRFEAAVQAAGGADEHELRRLALAATHAPFRQVIVTVGDQALDRRGLWIADFDLLARLPGLEQLDVISTDGLLASGLRERLHDLLPGIEEQRVEAAAPPPVLLAPPAPAAGQAPLHFLCRDREEELAALVRQLRRDRREPGELDRVAVVFQRPLPYLYLARQVFADAGLPWQALDSLPLAGEPYAAAIDLVFSALAADFTRGALIDLLRSPHFAVRDGTDAIDRAAVARLDRLLVKRKFLGGLDRLEALTETEDLPALRAARDVARALTAAAQAAAASAQIDAVLHFLEAHERLPDDSAPWRARHLRARGAVLLALRLLRDAHAAHDDRPLSVSELAGAVRRWIEGQTFSPRFGEAGVRLLDARAAAYADLDELRIVGLSEGDWPERSDRNIFYPQSLLAQLGWANEADRIRAARVSFQELLRLPRQRVSLSTFSLEDDGLVSPSVLLDDVEAVGLVVERPADRGAPERVFAHEALSIDPVDAAAVTGEAADWLAMRQARGPDDPRRRGAVGPRPPAMYAVSRVEKYLDCPFRYFAGYVLRLPEERDEEAWMSPLERGVFVHEVFEEFFAEWQSAGRGAITAANVAEAIAAFTEIAERRLADLPEGDRALERTFLLGSAAAAGLAERAFAFEIEHDVPVLERLLEYQLEGTFSFAGSDGARPIAIRSKADRIDLLADGTLRVIDYKLGRAPDRKRALQLPIYSVAAAQALDGRLGKSWRVARAGYVAFKHKGVFADIGSDVGKALADGQGRLVAAVEAIERGEFPVAPEDPFLCNWCPYPSVCRKDYVGDE